MSSITETAVAILAAIGGTFGIRAGTEEPRYTVVERVGAVEIRQYGPRLAAETTVSGDAEVARNAGFRAVAGYIFGDNAAKSAIAMTAPVAQTGGHPTGGGRPETIAMTAPVAQAAVPEASGQWRIQFFMPARYTRETLPEPKDPRVRIVEVPAQTYAVLRFGGSRTGPEVARQTARLDGALAASRWRASGPSTAWFYDPPWTPPFLRRNEVAAPVKTAG
ncbi:MAG: SOUL family heme-binding protein [Phenylobacterium sp.]